MQQYVPDIDKIITDPSTTRRDAIHTAVAPIEVGSKVEPGMKVVIVKVRISETQTELKIFPATQSTEPDQYDAAVSPFLERAAERGEWCWIMMRPNTVTSLRHLWTHDKFQPRPLELKS